jgi:PPOX class probable FMN-dependent enzyme
MARPRWTTATVETEAALEELLGAPAPLVQSKVVGRLNELTRKFIERSPFLCLATSDARGHCDVSPRGDPAGFVRILDDETLLLPERPGNRLADSLRNILKNPRVGLLFILPGITDTFRVNGRATLITDRELLAPCIVEGKIPKLGILIEIEAAFTHCSKAFLRSQLWDPTTFIDRAQLPTNGEIHRAILGSSFDAAEYDIARSERYARREGFY